MEDSFWDQIKSMFKKEFPNKKDPEIKEMVENMKECLEPKYNHLLTMLSSANLSMDIDVAILNALLQAVKSEKPSHGEKETEERQKNETRFNKYQAQLRLALTWNRVDVAQKFIFTDELKERVNLSQIFFKLF